MLKKLLFALLFSGASLLFVSTVKAESISSFNSDIQIQTDGSILVQETIRYDFGDLQRHGIFRDIYLDSAGVNPRLVIDQISVADDQGQSQPFTLSKSSGQLEIKIGDANHFITGTKVYRLSYRVQNALGSFTDHDELYWNVTGNEWQVPIQQASTHISLPSAQPSSSLSVYCYAGPSGSKTQCQQAALESANVGSAQSAVFAQSSLAAGEGLTVAFGWPKGITTIVAVEAGTGFNDLISLDSLQKNSLAIALPFVTLIAMLAWWLFRGRGPRARGVAVPQYEPLIDLTPCETGIMYSGSMSNKSLVAELIEAARTGYLKIVYSKKVIQFAPDKDEFTLERLKEFSDLPLGFRRSLLETLFAERSWLEQNLSSLSLGGFIGLISKVSRLPRKEVLPLNEPVEGLRSKITLSEIEDSFFVKKNINLLMLEPREQLITRGYFDSKSIRWFAPLILVFVIGFAVANIFLTDIPFFQYSLMFSLAIILIFVALRSTLSKKGIEARQYLRGLKMYLEVAEKDRLAFHNAPEKNSATFEKLLPYAIALGVEKQWAEQFKNLSLSQPNWYSDSSGGAFNAVVLSHSLHNFSSSFASSSSLGGTSGGGGGGSSGGGGGGGGGGSW